MNGGFISQNDVVHWRKNDYSFYEEPKPGVAVPAAASSGSAPEQEIIISVPVPDIHLSEINKESCRFCFSLPRTSDDYKVLGIFHLVFFFRIRKLQNNIVIHILIYLMPFIGIRNLPCSSLISHSIAIWCFAIRFNVYAALIYINKFYKLNLITVTYMVLGIVLLNGWCGMVILHFIENITPLEHFLVITVFTIYNGGYFFFLAVYMIIDMSFTISLANKVRFIYSFYNTNP